MANKDARDLRLLAPRAWAKGAYRTALDLYAALCRVEPGNPMHTLRFGDCLARLDRGREARDAYLEASDAFAASGMLSHAAATLRVVLRSAPTDLDALARLAQLKQRRETAADPLAGLVLQAPSLPVQPKLPREATREFSFVEVEVSRLAEITPAFDAGSEESEDLRTLEEEVADLRFEVAAQELRIARQAATIEALTRIVSTLTNALSTPDADAAAGVEPS